MFEGHSKNIPCFPAPVFDTMLQNYQQKA